MTKNSNIFFWTKSWIEKKQIPCYCLKKSSSSNDLAKKYAFQNKPSPYVFLVKKQSHGRGQGVNKWENSDLMISFLWEKNQAILFKDSMDYTKDLYQALKKIWPLPNLKTKAPNDLWIENKKLSGLLIEVLSQGSKKACIIGLGLNVFSCPKNINSTYLAKEEQNINSNTWSQFLDSLFYLWNQRNR